MNVTGKHTVKNKSGAKKQLSVFAQSLFAEWLDLGLPASGETVVVAVSGGADSTALVMALAELIKTSSLNIDVMVAHLDHGLRGAAGADDARWVESLAAELGFAVALEKIFCGARANKAKDNLEQAARAARYEFLMKTATKCNARIVATGHTMDDQAETVLLRLLRGSGAEGLSGMKPLRALLATGGEDVLLARPLLRWARRAATEKYCSDCGVQYRIDEMNVDERFARVRVRRQLVPLLETFNPRAVEAIARAAGLLHDDIGALDLAAGQLLEAARAPYESESFVWPVLRVEVLSAAPAAVRRRALRKWIALGRGDLRRVELVHLIAIENLLTGVRGGRKALLPGGAYVERRRQLLRFHRSPDTCHHD